MIILALQLTFAGLLLAGNANGQDPDKISVDMKLEHASLQESLLALQRKSGIRISFQEEVLQKENKKVSLAVSQMIAMDVLRKILSNTNLSYRLVRDVVIIDTKPVPVENGRIYGKVADEKGNSLPGATVRVTGDARFVTSTAVDGTYILSLPPGTYTIEVSYISYQTKRISAVDVKAGASTKLDVGLTMATNALKMVVIQSSYQKEAVAGLYAQQKNAAGITDGISSEQIARTPDNNMGQVLKRVSGVVTVDNRYVVVRGLTERYNQGMIDGIVLPSTDMNRRNFAFDVIPAEMVSNVVVNKTATPDVSAEFSGGQVSVNTLDIPVENFTQLSLGAGYNSNTLGKKFMQMGKTGKYDFLGFDDGHRNLPGNIRSWGSEPVPDYAVPQSKLFTTDIFKKYTSNGAPNQQYRLSLGRTYALKGNRRFGFVASANMRNTHETHVFEDVRNFEIGQNVPKTLSYIDSADRRRNGSIYKTNATVGAQFNAGIQGTGYKISLRNLFSQTFSNTLNVSEGMFAQYGFDNDDARTRQFFQNPEFTKVRQHKLDGEHTLTPKGLTLTWLGAVTATRQQVKDLTKYSYFLTGRDDGKIYYQSPAVVTPAMNNPEYDYRLFTDTKETDYNWAINLRQPFTLLGDKSWVKAGYNGAYKKRDLSATKMKVLSEDRNFSSFDKPYDQILAPENMGTGKGQAYYFADGNNGSQFSGIAKLNAAYLMLDQRLFRKLRLVYGVRAEQYHLENKQSKALAIGSNADVTGEKNVSYLPSVNATYSVTSATNIRASFSKTIVRPDFRETSYFGFYDPYLNADIVGDSLVSTKINNADLRYEWYPSPGEIFSISGFYKTFDKPIELVVDQDATQKVSQYRFQNQKSATNYGVELEFRKSLGFIANRAWLRNTTLFGNGSFIRSVVHTLSRQGSGIIVENEETRALYGQSPYTINAGISYAAPRYGFTISYNYSARRTYTIRSNPSQTEYENGRQLVDVQVFGRVLKQKMEIKLNVGNLLNTASIYYINSNGYKSEPGYKFSRTKNGDDRYQSQYDDVRYRIHYGVTPSLVITYKF